MVNVAVLASGRGSNLEALLTAQQARRLGGARVTLVVSDRPDARALTLAGEAGIKAEHLDPSGHTREAYDERLRELLATEDIDLVVLAGFLRILTGAFVRAFPNRIINIHPALLPAFPGLDAQGQALAYGVRVAGATTHFVDEQVDHGPIILQSVVPVRPEDGSDDLSRNILETEHRILVDSVRLFAEGRLSVSGRRVEIKGDVRYPGTPLFVPEVAT